MPETGNAYVDYVLQNGADRGLSSLGGLVSVIFIFSLYLLLTGGRKEVHRGPVCS